MQAQVANFNHTQVKGNNLRSKSNIHDRNFCLIFVGSPFFFKIIKALRKFELKNLMAKISASMVIVLRRLIIFEFSFVFKY